MTKECTLSTGKLPVGGLPRNSVVKITDHHKLVVLSRLGFAYHHDITSSVQNQQKSEFGRQLDMLKYCGSLVQFLLEARLFLNLNYTKHCIFIPLSKNN